MSSAVFISYAREDYDTVIELRDEIHRHTGVMPWMDVSDIAPGAKFPTVIARAINGCKVLICVISRCFVVSQWAQKEVLYASEHGKKIYPVFIDNTQLQGGLELVLTGVERILYKDEVQRESFFSDLSASCAGDVKDDSDLKSWMREAARFYSANQYQQALDLYRQCAEHGSVEAEFRLGVMLYNGEGVVRRRFFKEALEKLWDAALLGHARAQYYLGQIYEQRFFKKRACAMELYRAAADRGDIDAQERLAVIARENSFPCTVFRLFKALVIVSALLGLAVIIAIVVFLVKAGVI